MAFPSVGIGILNYNGRAFLERFLPFTQNITYPAAKFYLIDNDSKDDSLAFVSSHYPEITIIRTGGNYGVPGGYNIGFSQMTEKYVMILNTDVELPPGFLEPLVGFMEKTKDCAICQPKMLDYRNRNMYEHTGAGGGFMDILGITFCRGRIFEEIEPDTGQYLTCPVFWIGGACCLIRRDAYFKVGGMYEPFFMQFEEIELCWKFYAEGYTAYFCSESHVYHVGGGSLSYLDPKKHYLNFRNSLMMYTMHAPTRDLLWWIPIRLTHDFVATIFHLIKGQNEHGIQILKAVRDYFKWFFTEKNKRSGTKKLSLFNIPGIYKGSITIAYFIGRKRKFHALNPNRFTMKT